MQYGIYLIMLAPALYHSFSGFLVTVSYSSASENAGVINTNIRLASGVGTLQREVVVDVMTSDYSNSKLHASGKSFYRGHSMPSQHKK